MEHRDETQFAELYRLYGSAVWLYCRRRVGVDRADDAMGDVYLTVWRRIGEAPEPEAALPWLYRIAYLTVSNHWRSAGRRHKLRDKMSSLGVVPPTSVADQVVVRGEVREVLSLLQQMRRPDAEILRLAAWEHMDTQQIASVLGVSPDAAKQRLSRARKRLTQMYEKNSQPSQFKVPPLLRKEVSGD